MGNKENVDVIEYYAGRGKPIYTKKKLSEYNVNDIMKMFEDDKEIQNLIKHIKLDGSMYLKMSVDELKKLVKRGLNELRCDRNFLEIFNKIDDILYEKCKPKNVIPITIKE